MPTEAEVKALVATQKGAQSLERIEQHLKAIHKALLVLAAMHALERVTFSVADNPAHDASRLVIDVQERIEKALEEGYL